jgi:hypothetical protein
MRYSRSSTRGPDNEQNWTRGYDTHTKLKVENHNRAGLIHDYIAHQRPRAFFLDFGHTASEGLALGVAFLKWHL